MTKEKNGFLGLGKLLSTIKFKLMGGFLTKFLAGIYEKFKASNPKIAAAVGALCLALLLGVETPLETALAGLGMTVDLPANFLSLTYIVETFNLPIPEKLVQGALMILALLSGSKSTEFLDPDKREEQMEKQAKRIQARELKAIEKEAKRDAKADSKKGLF